MHCTTGPAILDAAMEYLERGWSLLPIPSGKKKTSLSHWKKYQKTPADEKQIRKWIDDGEHQGLAALMGAVSGDLYCRDYDRAETYHEWARKRPELAATLPTVRTGRGYHVFATAPTGHLSDFRQSIGKTGNGDITTVGGEIRADVGCYVVLPPSIHESGRRYEWIVPLTAEKPPEIDIFEADFYIPDPSFTYSHAYPHIATHEVHRKYLGSTQEVKGGTLLKKEAGQSWSDEIHEAIISTLPTGPGKRHGMVFQLGRALKAIPELAASDVDDLKPYVRAWHEIAKKFITTKLFSATWRDFKRGWPRIVTPKGQEFMTALAKSVSINPLPAIAEDYVDEPKMLRLVALCRELQKAKGNKPFFLSCRAAARALEINHMQANEWLSILAEDAVIELVAKGRLAKGGNIASSYRYLGPLT